MTAAPAVPPDRPGARAVHAERGRIPPLDPPQALAGAFFRQRRRASAYGLMVRVLPDSVPPDERQAAGAARRAAPRVHAVRHTFLPTDTLLFMLLLHRASRSAIFLLTALFGRVWCGWACPQTVYMEFLFRPIERCFEGGGAARRRSTRRRGTPLAPGGQVRGVPRCWRSSWRTRSSPTSSAIDAAGAVGAAVAASSTRPRSWSWPGRPR